MFLVSQFHKAQVKAVRKMYMWVLVMTCIELTIVGTALLTHGLPPLLALIQTVCWVVAAVIAFTQTHADIKKMAYCFAGGAGLVLGMSLSGFYVGAETDAGFNAAGTHVSSRSADQAVGSALVDPATFTAALLGYECRGANDETCSLALYYAGVGLVEASYTTSIALSFLLIWGKKSTVSHFSEQEYTKINRPLA